MAPIPCVLLAGSLSVAVLVGPAVHDYPSLSCAHSRQMFDFAENVHCRATSLLVIVAFAPFSQRSKDRRNSSRHQQRCSLDHKSREKAPLGSPTSSASAPFVRGDCGLTPRQPSPRLQHGVVRRTHGSDMSCRGEVGMASPSTDLNFSYQQPCALLGPNLAKPQNLAK